MNARALSQVGEPVCIEDAMAYAELQADVKALRKTNAELLLALKEIRGEARICGEFNALGIATIAIEHVEGIA